MNKDQYRLQIYHNRYIRGTVVSICKILIYALIYALVLLLAISSIRDEFLTSYHNNYNSYSAPSAGASFALIVILFATVAFFWAVINEILHKIKQNRQLTGLEDDYLNSKTSQKS